MGFKDHFSGHAGAYAAFRPTYPEALFDWLAARAPGRELAWDAATGNGQAAGALARRFARVTATDASAPQIAQARPLERVEFRVAPSEDSGLPAGSADLVTVAQALHWFDLPRFWPEVRRVARPGGLLAVWTYNLLESGLPAVDAALLHLYSEVVGPYWPPDRKLVEEGYRNLEVPFTETQVPPFSMREEWTLDQLCGYVGTWSAVAAYRRALQQDPVAPVREELLGGWGGPEAKRVLSWPLSVRVFEVG